MISYYLVFLVIKVLKNNNNKNDISICVSKGLNVNVEHWKLCKLYVIMQFDSWWGLGRQPKYGNARNWMKNKYNHQFYHLVPYFLYKLLLYKLFSCSILKMIFIYVFYIISLLMYFYLKEYCTTVCCTFLLTVIKYRWMK